MISQLLTELDGLENLQGVTVIAATNRPDIIDSALLRPGRFDRHIYIPVPDEEARKKIFEIHLRKKPVADDVDIEDLAKRTENYTGADIEAVCNEATMAAIREYIQAGGSLDENSLKAVKIYKKHFDAALEKVKPLSKREMEFYRRAVDSFKEE